MPRLRLIAAPAVLLLGLTGCAAGSYDDAGSPAPTASAGTATTATEPSAAASDTASAPAASASTAPGEHLDISSPDSPTVLVNKTHPMDPIDWAPQDLQTVGSVQLRADAAAAARRMIEAAARDGVSLSPISGYRSHQTQKATYRQWVSTYGQERADVASARPGYSEHQTGLAVDFGGSGHAICSRASGTPRRRTGSPSTAQSTGSSCVFPGSSRTPPGTGTSPGTCAGSGRSRPSGTGIPGSTATRSSWGRGRPRATGTDPDGARGAPTVPTITVNTV